MIRISNRLDQPLVINRGRGRVLHLLAGGSAVITDEELAAPEIQALVAQQALDTQEIKEPGTAPKPPGGAGPRRREG